MSQLDKLFASVILGAAVGIAVCAVLAMGMLKMSITGEPTQWALVLEEVRRAVPR